MSTTDVIFDLETIRLPENPGTAAEDKVPAAPHHQIVCAGKLLLQDLHLRGVRVDTEEIAGVISIVRSLNDGRTRAITWNGRKFDMPVLGARCMAHGIPFPRYFAKGGKDHDFKYRYAERPHMDLMDLFSDHGSGSNPSLDAYSRLIGLPGTKGDIDGGNVAKLYADGDLTSIVQHNLEDLVSVAALYLRLLFVRGELTTSTYVTLATDLLADAVQQAPALASFIERVDRGRLLAVYVPPPPAPYPSPPEP